MKLTFLGTRGEIEARNRRYRRHTSLEVAYRGRRVMIDCGEDWLGRLDQLRPRVVAGRPFSLPIWSKRSSTAAGSSLSSFRGWATWDRHRRSGSFILFNPGRLPVLSGIDAIALGETWDEAEAVAAEILPKRLRQAAADAAS